MHECFGKWQFDLPKKTMCACDCLMLLSIDVSGVGFACQSLHDCMCLVGIELSKCV